MITGLLLRSQFLRMPRPYKGASFCTDLLPTTTTSPIGSSIPNTFSNQKTTPFSSRHHYHPISSKYLRLTPQDGAPHTCPKQCSVHCSYTLPIVILESRTKSLGLVPPIQSLQGWQSSHSSYGMVETHRLWSRGWTVISTQSKRQERKHSPKHHSIGGTP